jgi:hypothetical protein
MSGVDLGVSDDAGGRNPAIGHYSEANGYGSVEHRQPPFGQYHGRGLRLSSIIRNVLLVRQDTDATV